MRFDKNIKAEPHITWGSASTIRSTRRTGGSGSENRDHGSLRAFLPLLGYKRHTLVFFEALVTLTLDVAVVREKVFAAGLRHDEAVALFVVEPFHDTDFCFQSNS